MSEQFHQDSTSSKDRHVSGFYTLLIVMILLFVSLILVRGLMTSNMQEVRSSVRDEVAHEVFHAVVALPLIARRRFGVLERRRELDDRGELRLAQLQRGDRRVRARSPPVP